MADNRQFGSARVAQFGDKLAAGQLGDSAPCAGCEAMLTDALDGTLSAADQAIFDAHTTLCVPCTQMLADARRGVAWLEMLRDPRPEPPAALLERILAQTSGVRVAASAAPAAAELTPAAGGIDGVAPASSSYGRSNVLPFRARFVNAARFSGFGQVMLQPRLAMTAAMAFFSVALTMNLTGVHLGDLRASDLKPSSLKRDFYSVNARAVQYYEGLRVVYELESRVHELQSGTESDVPAGSAVQPGGQKAAPAPAPDDDAPAQEPAKKPQRSAPNPGSSTIVARSEWGLA